MSHIIYNMYICGRCNGLNRGRGGCRVSETELRGKDLINLYHHTIHEYYVISDTQSHLHFTTMYICGKLSIFFKCMVISKRIFA